jgi:hypothetical protein
MRPINVQKQADPEELPQDSTLIYVVIGLLVMLYLITVWIINKSYADRRRALKV